MPPNEHLFPSLCPSLTRFLFSGMWFPDLPQVCICPPSSQNCLNTSWCDTHSQMVQYQVWRLTEHCTSVNSVLGGPGLAMPSDTRKPSFLKVKTTRARISSFVLWGWCCGPEGHSDRGPSRDSSIPDCFASCFPDVYCTLLASLLTQMF